MDTLRKVTVTVTVDSGLFPQFCTRCTHGRRVSRAFPRLCVCNGSICSWSLEQSHFVLQTPQLPNPRTVYRTDTYQM